MKTVLFSLAAGALLLSGLAVAGSGDQDPPRMRNSADVVTVSPVPAQLEAAPGSRVSFALNVNIKEKWHLYAHEDTMFIGIDLRPSEGFPLQDLQVSYPAGHEGVFFGEPVVILEGSETVKATAAVPADLEAGDHPLELAFTVQACDDKVCLAPTDIPVNLKLTVK
jgi:thiol:disulfide interchange protein DsbD